MNADLKVGATSARPASWPEQKRQYATADRTPKRTHLVLGELHRSSDFPHRSLSHGAGSCRPFLEHVPHLLGVPFVRSAAFLNGRENRIQMPGRKLLTIHTTDLRRAALAIYTLDRLLNGEYLVQVEHRADVRIAGVAAALASGIGHHCGELFRNHIWCIGQENRVVVTLRHLAAVRARQSRRGSEQRFRLRENPA